MAKPWPERPVSGANKSGKQQVRQREGSPIRACSEHTVLTARLVARPCGFAYPALNGGHR